MESALLKVIIEIQIEVRIRIWIRIMTTIAMATGNYIMIVGMIMVVITMITPFVMITTDYGKQTDSWIVAEETHSVRLT